MKEKKTGSVLWRLAQGPVGATEYIKYRVNGFVFSPRSYEEDRDTQDSDVCVEAYTTFRRNKGDTSPETHLSKWYGVISQILELDYTTFYETVFYCDWVKVGSGIKICPDSNLVLVKLNSMRSSSKIYDEPAILVEEASQVFYSKDLKSSDQWVVIPSPKGLTIKVDDLEKPSPGSFQNVLVDEPHLDCLLNVYGAKRPRVVPRRRA